MTMDRPKADSPDRPAAQPSARAVALEARAGQQPRLLAKGRGALAEAIVRVAFENGVRVREDGDLVGILEQLEIDSPIPVEALPAVMEILHYLYLAQGQATPEPKANPT